uniref:Uncharacterized protein n=1 Tax=Parastrongyloides trichosuri TaxID=131310 RepID=A0A0N4ZAL7_PARTI
MLLKLAEENEMKIEEMKNNENKLKELYKVKKENEDLRDKVSKLEIDKMNLQEENSKYKYLISNQKYIRNDECENHKINNGDVKIKQLEDEIKKLKEIISYSKQKDKYFNIIEMLKNKITFLEREVENANEMILKMNSNNQYNEYFLRRQIVKTRTLLFDEISKLMNEKEELLLKRDHSVGK